MMRLAALLSVALLLTACPKKCEFNAPCDCGNGGMGYQFCNSENEPGACNCGAGGGAAGSGGGGMGGGGGSGGGGAGGSGGGGGGSLPSITLQDFCAAYPAAACATRIACGRYTDAGTDICLQRESVTEVCRRAGLGFVNFNGVAAARCLMELQSGALNCASDFAPCGSILGSGMASTPLDVFSVRPNGCGTMTCGAGTRCDERCTGPQCLPPLDAGAACDGADGIWRDCPATTTCAMTDDGGYRCLDFTPRGGDCSNTSCSALDYCDFAATTPTCKARLLAEAPCGPGDVCFDGVCRADGHCGALDAGARCMSSIECGAAYNSETVCLGLQLTADGGTADAGVCGPRPRIGEPCSREWARIFDSCRLTAGEACLDGVCTFLEPFSRPLGSECPMRPWGYTAVPFYGFAACERGLACRPSTTAHPPHTGRCQPAQVEGGACRDEFECAAGLTCTSGEDGGQQCARLAGLGQSCAFTFCMRDLSCNDTSDGGRECGALSPIDGGCANQTCVPTAQCIANVCEALAPAGAPCDYGFTCQSGVCQLYQCVDQCMR